MNEDQEVPKVNQEKLTFPLYYLAKKPNYQSEEILGITDGPYNSVEQAINEGRTKYKWDITKYAVLETEQKFKVAQICIGN